MRVERAEVGGQDRAGRVDVGEVEDLEAANLEDVQAFFDAFYAPNNAALIVVGDFDPALHCAAINEPGSFSGTITLAAHLAETGGIDLASPLLSGAHLDSVTMVAEGKLGKKTGQGFYAW